MKGDVQITSNISCPVAVNISGVIVSTLGVCNLRGSVREAGNPRTTPYMKVGMREQGSAIHGYQMSGMVIGEFECTTGHNSTYTYSYIYEKLLSYRIVSLPA